MESSWGPTGPEADGRNSERSRSRGVGTRRGWSNLSSGKKRGQSTGTRSPDASTILTGGRFTNTAVPRFDGDGCWQQHLQICNAIAKSNGWTDEMAALQLFAHLEGEALNVALLMPEGERANREGISNYYNSPGRLAVFRRKFRTGVDPATFATELEILAVRGYGHLCLKPDGPGQVYCRSTELWAATSPRQCSSGYAHPGDSGSLPSVGESFRAGEGSPPGTWLDWELSVPVPVASVVQSDIGAPRGAGAGCSQDAPLESLP